MNSQKDNIATRIVPYYNKNNRPQKDYIETLKIQLVSLGYGVISDKEQVVFGYGKINIDLLLSDKLLNQYLLVHNSLAKLVNISIDKTSTRSVISYLSLMWRTKLALDSLDKMMYNPDKYLLDNNVYWATIYLLKNRINKLIHSLSISKPYNANFYQMVLVNHYMDINNKVVRLSDRPIIETVINRERYNTELVYRLNPRN